MGKTTVEEKKNGQVRPLVSVWWYGDVISVGSTQALLRDELLAGGTVRPVSRGTGAEWFHIRS